jgi:hypothetical protein
MKVVLKKEPGVEMVRSKIEGTRSKIDGAKNKSGLGHSMLSKIFRSRTC